jgi:large subunit ribosomal protein L24
MDKIRKGDLVVVVTGRDKGKRGAVLQKAGLDRVVVEGVNKVKKHVKPNPLKNQPGGILEKEMPIHVSNVALVNAQTQKPDRIGFRVMEDGRKVRVFRSNGEMVDL